MDYCRCFLQKILHTEVKHAYREANIYVDALAGLGWSRVEYFSLFSTPPNSVEGFVVFYNSEDFNFRLVWNTYQNKKGENPFLLKIS